jgi:crossover junction endodeoxyribonuclease RusA
VFELPYQRPPLSANRRKHWAPAHKEYREVAQDLFYLGKYWQQTRDFFPVGRVNVTLLWYPGSDRRADSDNPSDTLKPVLDGLTAAGIWPDDNHRYVKRTATEVVPRSDDPEQRTTPTVILEVEEVDDAGPGDRNSQERADGRSRPRPPERHGEDLADRPAKPVSPQRTRGGAPGGRRRYGHQRRVGG